MPDIFDELATESKGDVFDDLVAEQRKGDIFDELAGERAAAPGLVGDLANRFRRGGAVAMGRTAQAIARGGYALERMVGVDQDVAPADREGRLMERSELYRAGEGLVEGAQEAFSTDSAQDGGLAATLAESAGAMVPTILSGAGGRLAAALQYGLASGEEAAQEAVAMGQPEKADAAFAYTAPLGALTEGALGVSSRVLPGLRAGRVSIGGAVAKGAVKEAAQEGLEQVGQNVVARDIVGYDPQRPRDQGVGMSMLAGAVLGGPISGVGAALAPINQPTDQQAAAAEVPEPDLNEFGGMGFGGDVVEPGTSAAPPVPSSVATVSEQIRLTLDPASTRRATLLTPGDTLANVPDGLGFVETPHGVVLFNPQKVEAEEVVAAGQGQRFDTRVLGLADDGKAPLASSIVVSTSTDTAGDVASQLVPPDPAAIQEAAAAQRDSVPGGKTELRPAQEVLDERKASVAAEDRWDAALTRAIDALTMPTGQLFSDPLLIQAVGRPALKGALVAVRAAYRGTKSVLQAIDAGVKWLQEQGRSFDERRFRVWAGSRFAPEVAMPEDASWRQPAKVNHRRARELARPLQGQKVKNQSTGWDIAFNAEGIEHTLHDARSPEQFQSVGALPKLLAGAVHVSSEPDTKGRTNVRAWHTLAARVRIGNVAYRVKLTIKELNDGQRFYDHQLYEREEPALNREAGSSNKVPSPDSFQAGPGNPTPPADPVNPPTLAPKPLPTGEQERKLSPRLQDADWLTPAVRQAIRNRTYESVSMASSEAVAHQLVAELGPERAERLVFDLATDIPMAVRGGLTAAVAQEYSRRERTATTAQEAREYRERNADYLSRLMPMTTGFGQFINMLKAFSWQTAEGAVMSAQRLLQQATENHLASYRSLLEAARRALRSARDAAVTDTVNHASVQKVAAGAVDQAVIADDEIRRLLRGRVVEDLEPGIRAEVLEAGLDPDRVVAVLNQFWGPDPQPTGLVPLLEAAGVPRDRAAQWAATWIRRFTTAAGQIEWGIRQTLASERTRAARLRAVGSVWVRERAEAARGLVKALGTRGQAPMQRGAIEEFAARVARRLREQLSARSRTVPVLSDLELLREAAANYDRYQEVWDAAWAQAKEGGLEAVVSQLDAGRAQPFADSRMDRAIREKLRDWNLKMGQAVRNSRSALTGKLGDIIATDAGLDPNHPAHQRLRDAINERFQRVARDRKKRELEKLLRDQPDEGTERQLKSVLRRFVDLHDLGALEDGRYFDAIREGLGMRNLSPADLAKLRELANSLAAVPADQQFRKQEATIRLLNELEKIRKPVRWWEWPMAIWYANILSAVATQTVNLMSNAMNLAGNLSVQMVRNPGAIPATLSSVGRGISKGIPEALNVLRTGIVSGPRIGDKFGDPRFFQKVDSAWLKPWAMIGRALAAGDMLFFHPASEARQALLARSVARREGLSGQALRQRTQDLLANTPAMRSSAAVQATREGFTGLRHRRRVEEILQAHRDANGEFTQMGREFALATTFNNEPYGLLGWIAKGINEVTRGAPYAKLVVPFTNIVANVVNEGLNYTPWGSARALMARWGGVYGEDRDVTSWSQREMLADLHAKAAVGTLLLSAVFLKAAKEADKDDPEFMISGQGPKDAGRRDTLKATGWMPNSIKVGERYYSFQQTPVAVPLAGLGNYFDAIRYGKLSEQSALQRLTYWMAGTAKSVVQQSFLDGLARLVGAIERPSESDTAENMAAWAARTGSSFVVPNLVREADRVFDPTVYDEPGVRGAVLSVLPFARRNLKPVLNGLGEPVVRTWSQRFTSKAKPDPVWRELARLEIGVYPRALQYRGRALTDEELYDVVQTSGPRIRQRLERLLSVASYSRWSDEQQKERIQDIVQNERDRAKARVARVTPRSQVLSAPKQVADRPTDPNL